MREHLTMHCACTVNHVSTRPVSASFHAATVSRLELMLAGRTTARPQSRSLHVGARSAGPESRLESSFSLICLELVYLVSLLRVC